MNNTRRMGPILAVADMNYAFHDMIETAKFYEEKFNVPCEYFQPKKQIKLPNQCILIT